MFGRIMALLRQICLVPDRFSNSVQHNASLAYAVVINGVIAPTVKVRADYFRLLLDGYILAGAHVQPLVE